MKRDALAVHEAAHAVVAVALGREVDLIGVTPKGGHAYLDWGGADRATATRIILAGVLAHARDCQRPDLVREAGTGAGDDLDRAKRLVPHPVSASEWLGARGEEADQILDTHWPAVMDVAGELHRRS